MKLYERRKLAKEQLEKQLASGKKPNRGTTKEKKANPKIPLTEKDISRIRKTIANIEKKIT